MKIDKKLALGIIAVLLLVIINQINLMPKEALADVEGRVCELDSDCPCFGEDNQTGESYQGIGIGQCIDNACDLTYCVNIEPVTKFTRDNIWGYLRTKPFLIIGIILLLIFFAKYPKY
jgi:hypothetical protein